MTNEIMTIDSLIAKLTALREKHGGDVAVTVDNDFGESLFITNADVYCGFDEEDEEDRSKIEALNERNLSHDIIVSLEWKQF